MYLKRWWLSEETVKMLLLLGNNVNNDIANALGCETTSSVCRCQQRITYSSWFFPLLNWEWTVEGRLPYVFLTRSSLIKVIVNAPLIAGWSMFPRRTDQSHRSFLFIFPPIVSYHHIRAFNEVINSRFQNLCVSHPLQALWHVYKAAQMLWSMSGKHVSTAIEILRLMSLGQWSSHPQGGGWLTWREKRVLMLSSIELTLFQLILLDYCVLNFLVTWYCKRNSEEKRVTLIRELENSSGGKSSQETSNPT